LRLRATVALYGGAQQNTSSRGQNSGADPQAPSMSYRSRHIGAEIRGSITKPLPPDPLRDVRRSFWNGRSSFRSDLITRSTALYAVMSRRSAMPFSVLDGHPEIIRLPNRTASLRT
jgi:hypothetical protein